MSGNPSRIMHVKKGIKKAPGKTKIIKFYTLKFVTMGSD
jgi:hypothetical protein